MACAWTTCNECGHDELHQYLSFCVECGSRNVDAEYDPDEMYPSEEEE